MQQHLNTFHTLIPLLILHTTYQSSQMFSNIHKYTGSVKAIDLYKSYQATSVLYWIIILNIFIYSKIIKKWFLIPSNTEQSLCRPLVFNQTARNSQSFPLNSSKFVSPWFINPSVNITWNRGYWSVIKFPPPPAGFVQGWGMVGGCWSFDLTGTLHRNRATKGILAL